MNDVKIQFVIMVIVTITCGFLIAGSLGFQIWRGPPPKCPEVDTDAQIILLMDECERCKDKESKNWEGAARKRRDELEECQFLRKTYEHQNHEWAYGACNLTAKTTCGPFEWTCEEALFHAAIAERAYNVCAYGGFFPGYTMLDGWFDGTTEQQE